MAWMLRKLKVSKTGSGSTFLCKSRSDDTLLTASFNLRNRKHQPRRDGNRRLKNRRLKSTVNKVPSLRDLFGYSCNRRLKSTVNKVPSLRDLFGQVA